MNKKFIIGLGFLCFTSSAMAEEANPHAYGIQEVNATGISKMNVECSINEKGNYNCSLNQTFVNKPTFIEIQKKISDSESEINNTTPEQWAEEFKDCTKKFNLDDKKFQDKMASPDIPEHAKKFMNMLIEACQQKSPQLLLSAIKWNIREVEANTCTVTTFHNHDWNLEFIRKGKNSYQGIEELIFGGIKVYTLYRDDDKYNLWNLKMQRTADTQCESSNTFCNLKAYSAEWRWDAQEPNLECKYIEVK